MNFRMLKKGKTIYFDFLRGMATILAEHLLNSIFLFNLQFFFGIYNGRKLSIVEL